MTKKLLLLLLLLLVVAGNVRAEVQAGAIARQYNVEFYDKWNKLPTDTLMSRGIGYLRTEGQEIQLDSAAESK